MYGKVANKFRRIMNRFMNSQGENDDGFIESVGPLKEINPTQYQFQATVWRNVESEMRGEKFPGFDSLVKQLSKYLGRPKERTSNEAAWETVQPTGDSIRIAMVAYDAGSAETHSVKITVGPLSADLL